MLKEYSTSPGYADLVADSPDDFQVHTRVYTDPQVFAAEMAQIFEQTWVYVGHESEVPQPGDYKTAAVGRLPVIVSRAEDGHIHVLLNICRHTDLPAATHCALSQSAPDGVQVPRHPTCGGR
jgi:hypothetical protein